jgi:hypothetical protein
LQTYVYRVNSPTTQKVPRFSAISGECWRTLARTSHDDKMPKILLIFRFL